MDNSSLINLKGPAIKADIYIKPVGPLPLYPPLNPQLRKDLLAYLEAMDLLNEMRQKLKAMAAGLKHMKNVMFGVMEIMNMFQNVEGGKMRALSAVDNIDSDLRTAVSNAQGAVNDAEGIKGTGAHKWTPTPKQIADMKKLIDFINQLQGFVDRHGGAKGVIGGNTLKNLQDAINKIKSQFMWGVGNGKPPVNVWGNAWDMAHLLLEDVTLAKAGGYSKSLKNLQFGFHTLNQTVSALSTTTNTNLQFTADMFKQFLGIDESAMQSYQKGNLQMVQNQKSN